MGATLQANAASAPPVQSVNQNGGHSVLPEFVPLPREGQVEFYSGLRRGSLNLLILPMEANGHKPPVRSINLRRPGNTKGKRLIVLASLLGYLRELQEKQTSDETVAQPTGGN